MSRFWERNKRKSLLALLLLFLRSRKGLALALVMVMLLMLLSVGSTGMLGFRVGAVARFLGGARLAAAAEWLASRMGLDLEGSGRPTFEGLMAAFKAAKDDRNAGWGVFFRGGSGSPAGASGVDMVRGKPEDLAGAEATAKIKGGDSVSGISNPDQAAEAASGVEIADRDMSGERAGVIQAGFGMGANGNEQAAGSDAAGRAALLAKLGGAGAFAGKGFFDGSSGAPSTDRLKSALEGTSVPLAESAKVKGFAGKLSKKAIEEAKTKRGRAAHGNALRQCSGAKCAFRQLADGRSRTMMARDPNCTALNGCPNEYATTNTGAVYDGNKVGPAAPGVITAEAGAAPKLGDVDMPNVPSDAELDNYEREADQMEKDAEACRKADEKYMSSRDNEFGYSESDKQGEIQDISKQMNAACAGGGCSKSKAKKCKKMGNRMKAACGQLDKIMEAHYNACPLRQKDGPYAHQNCS